MEIECYSTLRNRIGPFHFNEAEDDGVSPYCFTMQNSWNNENENEFYYEPKRVVPFGLEKVVLQQI